MRRDQVIWIVGLLLTILGLASCFAAEPKDVICLRMAADGRNDRVSTTAQAMPVSQESFSVVGSDELLADTFSDATRDGGAVWSVALEQVEPAAVDISMDGFVEKSDGKGLCCLYVDVFLMDGTALYTNVASFDRLVSTGWNTATVSIDAGRPIRELRVYALLRGTATRMRFRPPRVHVRDVRELCFDGLPVESIGQPLRAGFYLRDVAAKTGFVPLEDRGTAKQVRLTAKCERRGAARQFEFTLSDLSGRDRAMTLIYALPLPKGDLIWHDGPRTSRRLAADGHEVSVVKNWNVGAGGLSRCPFGAVTAGGRGLAIGIDNSAPAYFRTVANSKLGVLFIAFDLGLAPEKQEASARFCVFSFDGGNGYRGALEVYRDLFPNDYCVRIRRHGQWMAFMKIADVAGWEDFGFRIMEGTEATGWDDAHDMLTFRYTEPGTWWMKMQPETGKATITIADALEEVKARAARKDPYALAWESSVTRDERGNPGGRPIDMPWCKGFVWSYNSAPGVSGEITDFGNKIGDAVLSREYSSEPVPKGVDGDYVDSADLYCTDIGDYDRRHFGGAQTPLCFNSRGRPVIFKGLVCYEYVRSLADRLHPQGRYVMVNSAPRDWCWLMPYADVGGDEVNWSTTTGWTPTSEDLLVYKLAAGCGKPMCFMMNTPLANLTRERVEQYMKRMLAYGFQPGLNCKTDGRHYYERDGLCDRDRDLHRKYVPLCRRVSEAGWCPVNRLTESVARPVLVEQFGENLLTLFNDGDCLETVRLVLKVGAETVRDLVSGRTFSTHDGILSVRLDALDVMVLEFPETSGLCANRR